MFESSRIFSLVLPGGWYHLSFQLVARLGADSQKALYVGVFVEFDCRLANCGFVGQFWFEYPGWYRPGRIPTLVVFHRAFGR